MSAASLHRPVKGQLSAYQAMLQVHRQVGLEFVSLPDNIRLKAMLKAYSAAPILLAVRHREPMDRFC